MVATKHSKLPKIVKTHSPYINPVISPVKMLQLSTPSNSNLSALTLHMVMEEQQLHLSPEICFSHITSDLSNPPVSPVKMVAIICTTTHAAEKKVNMLICKQYERGKWERNIQVRWCMFLYLHTRTLHIVQMSWPMFSYYSYFSYRLDLKTLL